MALDGLNDHRHQVLIAQIITKLNVRFKKNKTLKKFIATPETVVKTNAIIIPDVLVWNYDKDLHNEPVVAIEICRSSHVDSDITKMTDLMNSLDSLKECFVIDFERHISHRIFRKKNGTSSKALKKSKSERLKVDLLG